MAKNFLLMIFTLLLLGVFWFFGERFGLANLPGSYNFQLGGGTVTVPILSCIVLSVALALFFRFMRRF
ncbi:MAG: DUF2905 domain-containing protein [Oligoflexus sp.]|nr:DUF2905 domain-containing protein [Oligoflexus sp.]